jgi:hypothetical protein
MLLKVSAGAAVQGFLDTLVALLLLTGVKAGPRYNQLFTRADSRRDLYRAARLANGLANSSFNLREKRLENDAPTLWAVA